MRFLLPALLVALIPFLGACSERKKAATAPAATSTLKVMTTFHPGAYFAKRIAGTHAEVTCPLPKDADAASWEPSPEVLAQYQKADLIVVNGANFEHWPQTATLPESRVLVMADAFKADWIVIKNAVTHSHGPAGAHSHTGVNGHTWPDPINAIAQENAVRDALIARDPVHKADYIANARALEKDLLSLDARLKALPVKATLFASHPTYSYIAKRYGWKLVEFGLEPDVAPDAKQIEEIKKARAEHPDAKIMLWEDEPCAEAKKLMADAGLETVVFDPCEQAPEKGDYLSVMNDNIARLEAALKR